MVKSMKKEWKYKKWNIKNMYLADYKDEYLLKNRIGDVCCGKNVYILTNTHWLLCTDRVI